ncbi:NERD domain-containing protein, partial [Mariprofundus erugo]|uniref:nuclease-related domain-containing protein n=1 Tax=Mariprofundus erugo TaxID=2528639 RepID=UPI0010FDD127
MPLFLLAALFKSPWFKGVMGEAMVNLAARLWLDKNSYHLIKNVTIPTEDGTTQIDHIIVSRFGVFVVETKN